MWPGIGASTAHNSLLTYCTTIIAIRYSRRIYHVHCWTICLISAEQNGATIWTHSRIQGVRVHVHRNPLIEIFQGNTDSVLCLVTRGLRSCRLRDLPRVRYYAGNCHTDMLIYVEYAFVSTRLVQFGRYYLLHGKHYAVFAPQANNCSATERDLFS